MLYLKKEEKSLVVDGDAAVLRDPVIKAALAGFGFTPVASGAYVYNDVISTSIVAQIAEFFEDYEEDLEMDNVCSEYNDKRAKQICDLTNLKKESLCIKNVKNLESIDVPMMNKEKNIKPYQIMPILHAVALGNAANFSVPGSGKTWMAYSTYQILKHRPKTEEDRVDKLLIIGPLSSFRPWETEYQEMMGSAPCSIRITGDSRMRRNIFDSANRYEIFLASYTIVNKDESQIARMLQNNRFMVIVDESHHIKNPESQRSMAIRRISEFARKRMILTGTPIPNKLEDLWSQITFLYPSLDVLGTLDKFQYEMANQRDSQYLNKQLAPFFTRVSKSALGLPVPKIIRTPVSMSPIQRRIYLTIAGHIRANDEHYNSDMVAMRRWRKNSIMYLLEAATDPSLLTKNTQFNEDLIADEGLPIQDLLARYPDFETPNKIKEVMSLAEKMLKQSEKIIIWCSFIATIKKLEFALKKFNPLTVYGEIPTDDEKNTTDSRESRIDKFKNSSANNLLIANPASMAESISLHRACHHAIYVDRTFNGGNYFQSLERIHRIGIDPNTDTTYTIFMSKNSIDYDVDDRLEIKKRRMQDFLGDDAFKTLDIDLSYHDPIDADQLDEDYKAVLRRLRDTRP